MLQILSIKVVYKPEFQLKKWWTKIFQFFIIIWLNLDRKVPFCSSPLVSNCLLYCLLYMTSRNSRLKIWIDFRFFLWRKASFHCSLLLWTTKFFFKTLNLRCYIQSIVLSCSDMKSVCTLKFKEQFSILYIIGFRLATRHWKLLQIVICVQI